MKKVTFNDKINTIKNTGIKAEELIRAEDINELKTVLNSAVDTLLNTQSEVKSTTSTVANLTTQLTQLSSKPTTTPTATPKPKKSIAKSGDCPSYKSERNLYYLTDTNEDMIEAITIIIKFKDGEEKCVTIIPTDKLTKFSFDVTGNEAGQPYVWYFEVRPVNTNSVKSWRDIYVKFMGAHSLYNGTWGTNPNNAIKQITAISLFTPK